MMDPVALFSTAFAFFVVAASPGPATISNATVAMSQGRRTGLVYGLGLSLSFDVLGLVTVIEPAEDPDDYAHIRLFPKGTVVEPQEAAK